MIISSRRDESLELKSLSQSELVLMSALLYNVRLGNNCSQSTDAAFTLMTKIENFTDAGFMHTASMVVDLTVMNTDTGEILNSNQLEIRV